MVSCDKVTANKRKETSEEMDIKEEVEDESGSEEDMEEIDASVALWVDIYVQFAFINLSIFLFSGVPFCLFVLAILASLFWNCGISHQM